VFSEKFDRNIRIAGVSHIVAASGYNVTILILAGSKLFKFLPYKIRLIILLGLIWSFCLLSGLSPSIVRACIMTSISLLAMFLGRKSSVHIVLPLASCIFTIVNPKIVFDVGFQLSVVATLGLIYLQPTLSHIAELIFKKKSEFLSNTLFPTLSCTLATFCITIPTFQTISVWAVFANCLILPVIETTMFLGAIGLLFSPFSFLISKFFFEVINVQLKYFELVVNMIDSVKWGYWELDNVSNFIPIVIAMFLVLLCIYFYPVDDETHNYYLKISD
jgi:competence protein ComEC